MLLVIFDFLIFATFVIIYQIAVFELADQIRNGELPDPDTIFLPFGSGCTTSGIIAGISIVRSIEKKVLEKILIEFLYSRRLCLN